MTEVFLKSCNDFVGVDLGVHQQTEMHKVAVFHDLGSELCQVRRSKELVSCDMTRLLRGICFAGPDGLVKSPRNVPFRQDSAPI